MISKIALINPRLNTWSPNAYIPLGLTYIATVLEQTGCDVEIIDLNVERINLRNGHYRHCFGIIILRLR